MRPQSRLPLLVALSLLATTILAIPLSTQPLSIPRRSRQICSNAPPAVAGTLLPPRAPASSGSNNFIYCAHGTRTYVVIKTGWAASNSDTIRALLNQAFELAVSRIRAYGDRVAATSLVYGLIGSVIYMTDGGMVLRVANTNNHQTTWGVLGSAMDAMASYVAEHGGFDRAEFWIYDGDNEVAMGILAPSR